MKIEIALHGDGGHELDSKMIRVRREQDEAAVIRNAVISAVEDWTLTPGDTIHIRQVE